MSSVVAYMLLPSAQQVYENIVTFCPSMIGELKYCELESASPLDFGGMTSIGGVVNLFVFQLNIAKPQPSAR